MAATDYRFTFADFDPNRPLSKCREEPRMAGYIRWLRMRAELLLPYGLPLEESELAQEWWDEMESEDFRWQRGMQCSHHARFDLDPDGDWDEYEFPANVSAMSAWVDSHTLLHSDDPDPVWPDDGTRHRVKVRFHEMLVDKARSDLYEAIGLLIRGSTQDTPDQKRLEHEREALTLVIGAAELVNRAERHAQAGQAATTIKRMACARKSKTAAGVPRNGSLSFEPPPDDSDAAERFSSERKGWFERHESYLTIGYGGVTADIDNVTRKGALTLGFYCLLELLRSSRMPEVSLLTLAASFKNTVVPERHSGKEEQAVVKNEVKSGRLGSRTSLNDVDTDDWPAPLKRVAESLRKYNRENDEEKVSELSDRFKVLYAKWTAAKKKEMDHAKDKKVTRAFRQGSDPNKRITIGIVGRALENTIARLKAEFPDLHDHLRDSIKPPTDSPMQYLKSMKRSHLRYTPKPPVEWTDLTNR